MSKIIKLSKGYETIVDDDDYNMLMDHNWQALELHKKDRPQFRVYAVSKRMYMHRLIMNSVKGTQIDHRDGNSLNNQKYNLRIVTNQQNAFNAKKTTAQTFSKYKGVYKDKNGMFRSCIMYNYKYIWIGRFKTEEECAQAYNDAACDLFGEKFARLNIIK